ncbi:hypothetical protein ACR6C2_07695 [Streptomyces sp. INA 01156]
MGARSDLSAGPGSAWPGYDLAPHRWVLRKTFTAPEDGIASVSSVGFRGDGGARVRVNGVDACMYGQWNQPATTGTAQIPVTACPTRSRSRSGTAAAKLGAGPPGHRHDQDAAVHAAHGRGLPDRRDGQRHGHHPGRRAVHRHRGGRPVRACRRVLPSPPPETRVDVETGSCLVDDTSGDVIGRVLVERVYDDQTGERTTQRYVDPVTGDPVTVPAGRAWPCALRSRAPTPTPRRSVTSPPVTRPVRRPRRTPAPPPTRGTPTPSGV